MGWGWLWLSQQTQVVGWPGSAPAHPLPASGHNLSCFAPKWAIHFILGPLWKETAMFSLCFPSYASYSCGSFTCGPARIFLAAHSLTSYPAPSHPQAAAGPVPQSSRAV